MEEFMPMAIQFAKNHTLMVAGWVGLFIATIYVFMRDNFSKVKVISNAEAVNLMNTQNAVVLDLRTIDEFQRGHIIHSQQVLPSDIKKHNLGKLEQHKDIPVILVCNTGMTARASADILVKQGFNHVYSLKEGISGWAGANLPLVK